MKIFNDEQIDALKAMLDGSHVATRSQSGRTLSYIEGWWAISEANRIFGFDGWARETVDLQETSRDLVNVPGYGGKPDYDQWRVSFLARVRITVGGIVREGTGYGSGMAKPEALGDAIESAAKEAETDAMKRALMTFGNPFGLALYDKTQENVSREVEPPPRSSSSLKRSDANGDDAWERLIKEVEPELLDCKTLIGLEALRATYRKRVTDERWPGQWKMALKTRFDAKEDEIMRELEREPAE